MLRLFTAAFALLCASLPLVAAAQSAPPTQRLRGTVQSFDGSTLVVVERSGPVITLVLDEKFGVNEVFPIEPSAIAANAYVGIAAVGGSDGTMRALEVLVFPEAARGSGEGHGPWDPQPGSTMTNATVAQLAATPQGRSLTLKYKDGEKTVLVPADVPIVTFKPGDRSLLVPGAKVVVFAQVRDGKPTAMRALAGRDGFGSADVRSARGPARASA